MAPATSGIVIKHIGYSDKKDTVYKAFRNIRMVCKDLSERIMVDGDKVVSKDDYLLERLFNALALLYNEKEVKDNSAWQR